MTVESLSAQEVIEQARVAYSVGLISEERLELVTHRAETEPGYDGALDIPYSWEIEHELRLRRRVAHPRLAWWYRFVDWFAV